MPGRHWLLKTLRIDHEIAYSHLTTVPMKKMKHHEIYHYKLKRFFASVTTIGDQFKQNSRVKTTASS
jgi:hypothetical protein